jgi:hypothetical protein
LEAGGGLGEGVSQVKGLSLPEGYIGVENQLAYTPTNLTLDEVRRLSQPTKWQAGEQFAQELYGSAGQRKFPTTWSGGRVPDAPVDLPGGGVLGIEVKTYNQWTTIQGREEKVPGTFSWANKGS